MLALTRPKNFLGTTALVEELRSFTILAVQRLLLFRLPRSLALAVLPCVAFFLQFLAGHRCEARRSWKGKGSSFHG